MGAAAAEPLIGRDEPSFNEALGAALRQAVARWRESPDAVQVERTRTIADAPGKHPDILVTDGDAWPVAIEASFDGRDADRDALRRLGLETEAKGLPIETAVAVHVPATYRQRARERIEVDLLRGSELTYSFHQRTGEGATRRWPEQGFVLGTVFDLAAMLPLVALPREFVDQAATDVAKQVQWAADRLQDATTPDQQERIAAHVQQRTGLKGLTTIMMLWLNALLTQAALHERHRWVPSPESCRDSGGYPIPEDLAAAWRAILQKNWRPIFEPAQNVMEKAGAICGHGTSSALRCLLKAVNTIKVRRLGSHINVGAELFPKLSDDRKEAAAFYTQPAAAEFLAVLTITEDSLPPETSWGDPALWEHARLADMACGTGTLLRAGYRRVAALHEASGAASVRSTVLLHRTAMETGLYGTDISPIASHLTSSSLAAMGSGDPYRADHVGWVRVGGKPPKTGALEYFQADQMDDLFGTAGGRSTGVKEEGDGSVYVGDESLAWALMNPPYSRTRGGQSAFDVAGLTDAERKACQQRWRALTRDKAASNQAGMAASFVALADQKLRPGGRIGFVLPLTAAFADTWTPTRQLLETGYVDVVAVAVLGGKALGRDAISADTGMEEMMLVATKRPDGKGAVEAIRCVTLYAPLVDPAFARETARSVARTLREMGDGHLPVRAGDDEIGHAVVFRTDGSGRPWSPLGAASPVLGAFADALGMSGVFGDLAGLRSATAGVAFGRMQDLFAVGPTHDLIGHPEGGDPRGAFQFRPLPPGAAIVGDSALWRADAKSQRQLEVRPTHQGYVPQSLEDRDQARMRKRASTLFYARNLRWTSQSLLAATTGKPVMGGRAWTALEHAEPHVLKAFSLWANSTLGGLLHWSCGQRTQTGRSTTQIGALKRMPVPLLDRLDAPALAAAAATFDRIKNRPLLPLCQAHQDPVRHEIDAAVVRMLALPAWADEVVKELRSLWCREPSVHGNNKAALALLQ